MKKIKIKKISLSNQNSIAFFNMLGPILLNGINFFTLPVFTRMLSTEDFGIVSVYITWVSIMSIIIGFQTQGSIGTAFAHLPHEKRDSYISSILAFSVMGFVIIFAAALILLNPLSLFFEMEKSVVIIVFLHAVGAFGVTFATMKYTFLKEAHKTFFISLIVSLTSALLSVALILLNATGKLYLYRIVGMALPNVLVGAYFIIRFIMKGKVLYSKEFWKFCLPITIPLVFHGLSHIFLSQISRVVIQKKLDFSQAGIYNLAFTFTQVLSIVYTALNNTWVPFYYDDLKNKNYELIAKKTRNYVRLFTVLTMGFILVSPEVIRLFADNRYSSGIPLLPLMAMSVYFMFLYSFPVNFQFFHRKTVAIAVGTMSSAALNLILTNILTPRWGLIGAAAAMLVAYGALFLFHQIIAFKFIKKDYHNKWGPFLIGMAFALLSVVMFYTLFDLWIIRWVCAAGLGIYLLRKIYVNKGLF